MWVDAFVVVCWVVTLCALCGTIAAMRRTIASTRRLDAAIKEIEDDNRWIKGLINELVWAETAREIVRLAQDGQLPEGCVVLNAPKAPRPPPRDPGRIAKY